MSGTMFGLGPVQFANAVRESIKKRGCRLVRKFTYIRPERRMFVDAVTHAILENTTQECCCPIAIFVLTYQPEQSERVLTYAEEQSSPAFVAGFLDAWDKDTRNGKKFLLGTNRPKYNAGKAFGLTVDGLLKDIVSEH